MRFAGGLPHDPAQVGNTVWSLFPRDTKYFGPGGACGTADSRFTAARVVVP